MASGVDLDWAALADQEYVAGLYRARQLQDAAAYGLGVAKPAEEGPTGELLEDAERLKTDLRLYIRAAWPVLEPATGFVSNWHIDAIAEHLQAVTEGQILRLLMNVPPRCMKSLTTSVFWMTWEWTRTPWTRWMFLTYHDNLSTRDSVKSRRLIKSPWYQERWGHLYQMAGDQNLKTKFENNRSGFRLSSTMEGFATGEGGDRIVVDDPTNPKRAESEVMRDSANRAWDETISTRLNDPLKGAKVIMMQRQHVEDLTGHVLKKEADQGWVHLMLPMRYDPARRCVTVLGFEDPRTKPNQLLDPGRFPEPAVAAIARTLGPYGEAGQFQQEPYARSGGQFERAWFKPMDSIPGTWKMIWVRYWDQAGTEGGGKYTAGVLMGYCLQLGVVVISDVVRGQWGAGNRYTQIKLAAEMDALRFGVPANGTVAQPNKLAVLNVIEQEPGSGGKDSAQETLRYLRGYRAEAEPASGDKFIRADPLAGAAKNGDVYVLVKPWTDTYLSEMEAAGPGAKYLDQMDASSGAYNRLMKLKDQRVKTSGKGVDMKALDDEDFTQGQSGWVVR